jgi:hypothetical protein
MPYDSSDNPSITAMTVALTTIATTVSGELQLSNTSIGTLPDVIVPGDVGSSPSATEDFMARYLALDTFAANEDGSDLSHMRILKFNNGKFGSQVFPINNLNGLNLQPRYQNFIVTSISSGLMEKSQILKTSGTTQIYGFDAQIEVLAIQGVLRSTDADPWDMAMVFLWDDLLRLTKLLKMNLIAEFGYQSSIYWGYPISFNWQKSSNMQYLVSYSMQFAIIKRALLAKTSNQQSLLTDLNNQIQNIPSIS